MEDDPILAWYGWLGHRLLERVCIGQGVVVLIVPSWWQAAPSYVLPSFLLLLVVRELWNERNARVFRWVSSMPSAVFAKIKHEASLWVLAGAKHLRSLMPRE